MSIKTDRIGKMILREVSYVLETEIKDEDIKFVTVTDCRVTTDLGFAKIYVTVLNDDKRNDTLKALNNAKGFIRSQLYDRVDIRHIPELTFVYDESISNAKNIEDIIEKIHEKNED